MDKHGQWSNISITLLLLLIGLSSCSPKEEHRILVIHSYEETYGGYPDYNEMISRKFEKKNIKADIRTLYLDCENYLEKQELERMFHLLDSVSVDWKPEVIIVNEDQATYSLLKCGAPLVKEVPVIFGGVNYPNWKLISQYPNVTGFHDKIDFKRNIAIAKKIFGNAISLFTVLDSTFLDNQIKQDAREQLRGSKVIGFIDSIKTVRTPKQELQIKLKEGYTHFLAVSARVSGKNDVSLMWILNRNYRERCYIQLKRDFTTENFGNVCMNPCLTVINEGFGYGEKLIGGYLTTLPVQVEEEVNAAVSILHGTSPLDIPIAESRKEYVADWNAMLRMGLRSERIPSGFTIINIPFNKRYPLLWGSMLITSIILLLSLFACLWWLYLREQRRKKQALCALAHEKETLALAIAGGATYAWQLETKTFVFEDAFWHSQGISPRKLTFEELKHLIHPDYWESVQISWKNLQNARKKIAQLPCNFDGKGYQWWEFRYSTNPIGGGQYKTAGLLQNVQKVKDREEELEAARLLAEKAELKQSFLANMSHEIRTPLNSIVGFSNILAVEEDLTPEEREEYVDTINKNSELLLKLVNDILELSRIESDYMSFVYQRYQVKDLIDDVYSTHQVLISPRLEFLKETEETALEINVDRDRLIQVLTNFLNNADKFTESGTIRVGYHYFSDESKVEIYVEDTGRGIPLEEQRMIFGRFYKQNEFSQGAGLGLSICKVIVEKLGGTVTLQSEVGKGSRFAVILPCWVVA